MIAVVIGYVIVSADNREAAVRLGERIERELIVDLCRLMGPIACDSIEPRSAMLNCVEETSRAFT